MEFETGKKSNNRQQYRRKPVHESDAALEMGKTQPQDIEFEEAVLGAIMLEKDAYSEVSDLPKVSICAPTNSSTRRFATSAHNSCLSTC